MTWIDINAPYYPEYASAYGNNRFGRSPLSEAELKRIQELTGSADVNFTRPSHSSCLEQAAELPSNVRAEVLRIIRRGTKRLTERPRGDMPDFQVVDAKEVRQESKYEALQRSATQTRQAIIAGDKVYQGSH